jgi:hypothetical protein
MVPEYRESPACFTGAITSPVTVISSSSYTSVADAKVLTESRPRIEAITKVKIPPLEYVRKNITSPFFLDHRIRADQEITLQHSHFSLSVILLSRCYVFNIRNTWQDTIVQKKKKQEKIWSILFLVLLCHFFFFSSFPHIFMGN